MENSKEIFSIALGLEVPWQVLSVYFKENNNTRELHIDLSFQRGNQFVSADGNSYTAYDTVDRTWQHLNFFEHKCFIHASVPRVKQKDGKVVTQQVPWARKGSGFTLLFEAYSMLLIENEMPVKKASSILGIYPQRLWNVFSFWVSRAHGADSIEELETVGFDETSSKKGHNYVTTMVDIKQRRVLFAGPGKGANNIKESVDYLKAKLVDTKCVNQVCIDMSPAFISGCMEHLPEAAITFDKFHVIKEVNNAMDELRKAERRGNDMLKGHRYTFLKNKLVPKLQSERDLLLEMYPRLGDGYRLMHLFKDFWDIENKEEAEGYLAYWCDIASESKIAPFVKVVNTIKAHWSGILNYIESKINNGILEGINSKIQLAKKRARGYRNINNFINMIYFTCGKLKFDYPLYSI